MPLPSHLTIEIVTPERGVVQEQVDEAGIPGAEGCLGVLPGHTPLLVSLQVGELWFRRGAETTWLSVGFGFAEILPDRIRILAGVAERADEIDVERAEQAVGRAQARLASPAADLDFERAQIALRKSTLRLQVARKARRRGASP